MSRFTNKDIESVLDSIDEVNPFATYLNDNTLSRVDGWVDTGSYVLNSIISGSIHGGIPKGRVTMLAGESMTGKSLFVQKILANAQKQGITPVIFDTENAVDSEGCTCLMLAVQREKYVLVDLLMTNGADIELMNSNGKTAMDMAPTEKMGQLLGCN